MIRPMYLSRLLAATYFVGVVGTTSELVLMEHYEDAWQVVPLVLLALGIGTGAWYARRPTPVSRRAFGATLVAYAVSGAIGVVLHYRGNVEFERETYPELGGLSLVWESLTGATPALAPGTMLLLAMLGYAMMVARTERDPGSGI